MRRRSLVAAVAALGVCLSLASFDLTRQDQQRHLQDDFARRAENHSALVREIMLNFESALFGLRNLFVGSNRVTAAEFATAAHEILQRYHGITALEWVPIVPHANRAAVEAQESAESGKVFQFVTGELMRSLGYAAETSLSGEDAIERVRADPARYAVVLLDCVMPRVSGEHALAVLQGIRPDLPVILMSGNNERGSQNGAVPFLTKPFSRATLEEMLPRIRTDGASA
ncbi:MAG: hypothetical protein RIS54_1771 [Verrucomicrobiota bacterium]